MVQGEATQLLGTMTHGGGWIDPQLLVERLNQVEDDQALIEADLVLSMLRLAPDNRAAALTLLGKSKNRTSEYGQALRYALGGKVELGDSAPLWVAAARSRAPFDDDDAVEQRFPDLGPDTGRVATYDLRRDKETVFAEGSPTTTTATWDEPKNPHFDFPTLLVHEYGSSRSARPSLDTKPEPREMSNYAATVWPLNRDAFYAHRYVPSDDLDPLFDVNSPMNEPQSHAAGAVADFGLIRLCDLRTRSHRCSRSGHRHDLRRAL